MTYIQSRNEEFDKEFPPNCYFNVLKEFNNQSMLGLVALIKGECVKKEKNNYWVGENHETEEMEVIENPTGLYGTDMYFAYNQALTDIINFLDTLR